MRVRKEGHTCIAIHVTLGSLLSSGQLYQRPNPRQPYAASASGARHHRQATCAWRAPRPTRSTERCTPPREAWACVVDPGLKGLRLRISKMSLACTGLGMGTFFQSTTRDKRRAPAGGQAGLVVEGWRRRSGSAQAAGPDADAGSVGWLDAEPGFSIAAAEWVRNSSSRDHARSPTGPFGEAV